VADQDKIGTDWSHRELDAIVADYFAMLQAERTGVPFVKAKHRRALMDEIGRTNRSVEFKHMNISAVLRELGLPTIRGYKPKFNFQGAIFDAIDRYLTANPAALGLDRAVQAASTPFSVFEPLAVFEEAAPLARREVDPKRERLDRLVRKFDPTERDFKNRELGKAGEALIVDFERARLAALERKDLASKVRWVAQEDGDGAGYDILSFDPSGRERLIEVKTTHGTRTTPFFLSRNERSLSDERPDAFRIYRVFEFGHSPRLFRLKPPLEASVILQPETYRASFS
jgi:hypothetical protein